MRSQRYQRTVLDVAAFDRVVIRLGLTRKAGDTVQPSNNKIGHRLGVSHSTVGRARRGSGVGEEFIAAVTTRLPVIYEEIFRTEYFDAESAA